MDHNKFMILLSILTWITSIKVESARWSHSTYLSPDYRLLWSLGPGLQDITFEVQVKTLGYVTFGFSQDGRMAGADIVVGWVDNGQVYFQDRHIKDSPGTLTDREPEVDPSQDYQLLLGYENNTHTVLRFRRRLNTCDHHDVPITNDTMRILWSYRNSETSGGGGGPFGFKFLTNSDIPNRGVQSLYLLQKYDEDMPRPEELAQIWELRNPAIEGPSIPGDTLHWCRVFRLPSIIVKKHHLIRYEPLQYVAGTNGLQHIFLYECQGTNEQIEKLAETHGSQCPDSHAQLYMCNTMVASWAKGSEGFSFPTEVGYPLDVSNKYYLMETRYTSRLDGTSGSLDGSGLRLYHTLALRKYDAGIISLGMDPSWRHIIPPGQNQVISSGHCVSECTRQAFKDIGGINMFAVATKTHKIGKRVVLKQIRGNTELAPLISDDNVDSNYQDYRKLNVPVKVFPGDHLITECSYNSSGRSAITLGGLTSREETCLVMGLYYPRQKSLSSCHSLPSLPTVLHSLGIQELSPSSNPVRIASPPELAGMTLESRLVSYDWSKQFQSFQETTMKGLFNPICRTALSTLLPGTDKETHYPNISNPYYNPTSTDQCSHRTEKWPGGGGGGVPPLLEMNDNRIENVARSKVSRSSSSPTPQESLGLSRLNSATSLLNSVSLMILIQLLITFWFV